MAALQQDPRTGNWLIKFRWAGGQFTKSTETDKARRADATLQTVEDTIGLLKQGRIEVPADADPAEWIMSGGKLKQRPAATSRQKRLRTLGEIADRYLSDQLDKAESTLEAERKHIGHLQRALGKGTLLRTLDLESMQQYVNQRVKQTYRGKKISGSTVRKELVTFHQVWAWARKRKYVETDCPIYDDDRRWAIKIPKPTERPKFQTWAQIERSITRSGLPESAAKELWSSLFLEQKEVIKLLQYVKKSAAHPFIHPMFVFAAYTGARRGEILRSEIGDFEFEGSRLMIRERKRRKDMEQTFRFVPIHPRLRSVMKTWFEEHPGGPYAICAPLKMARRPQRTEFRKMGPYEAHHHFKQTLRDSKWDVIRGFHTLRHSFGSNLARSGDVSRDTIGEWMGHSTEEMKTLYQHLFPQDGQRKISVLT